MDTLQIVDTRQLSLNQFFSAAEARIDRWRTLNRIARALESSNESRIDVLRKELNAVLEEIAPLEELNGYPGPHLMSYLRERLHTSDWKGLARLVQRISAALLSNSYRDDPATWSADEEGEGHLADILPPSVGRGQSRKPYFEVLIVSPSDRSTWPSVRETFRRLRRDEDQFVYEPLVVGSFEDAILATIFNYNLQSIVMFDGFG